MQMSYASHHRKVGSSALHKANVSVCYKPTQANGRPMERAHEATTATDRKQPREKQDRATKNIRLITMAEGQGDTKKAHAQQHAQHSPRTSEDKHITHHKGERQQHTAINKLDCSLVS